MAEPMSDLDRSVNEASPTSLIAGELIRLRHRIDVAESQWMGLLAEFDLREGWKVDGHLSAVEWLLERCALSRSAAKERLRVAHELRRRPLVAERFVAGGLSYAKVRAITRVVDAGAETDKALLAAAEVGTCTDLDRLAAEWKALTDQDDPRAAAEAAWERRGMRRHRQFDGNETIELVLDPVDAERLVAAVDAYLRRDPVDKASIEALSTGRVTWSQRRADGLVDLVEEGLAHATAKGPVDVDAAQVSVMVDYDTLVRKAGGGLCELAGGRPLTGEAARRLACDAGLVRIVTRGRSEVLDVGRQTRHWPRAIRRAIKARHGGRCAAPGCQRRIIEIHHLDPWADHGRTAVHLGVPLCRGHHRLVHELGWTVAYDTTTGTTTFTDPHGNTHTTTPMPHAPYRAA